MSSAELKTVRQCTSELETALMGCDRELVHFLEMEGFISSGVRDEILNPRSILTEAQKAVELVRWIRNRVDQESGSFHILVNHLKKSGKFYRPIVEKLEANLHILDPVSLSTSSQLPGSHPRSEDSYR